MNVYTNEDVLQKVNKQIGVHIYNRILFNKTKITSY